MHEHHQFSLPLSQVPGWFVITGLGHTGMSNKYETRKIMLAFGHFLHWYDDKLRVVLPEAMKPLVLSWDKEVGLQSHGYYVPDEVDHHALKFNATFSSRNDILGARA